MTAELQTLLLYLTPLLVLANWAQSVVYLPRAGWKYYLCFFAFAAAMMGAILAPTLPLMWVAIELTTLVSAPLIAHNRTKDALEAMWKYLLICSIGIGLALFGIMLILHAQKIGNLQWYKAGFAIVLAGFGTKMGLAPFHTWLPDAHSEAPAPVSALLSGALLNCSFFAIVRVYEMLPPEALPFANGALLTLGFLSVAIAAIFMVRQTDFKRLLAYSSVEHMGILAIFLGLLPSPSSSIGRVNIFDIMIVAHIIFHSLTKTCLFLTAGNILHAYGTRAISAVQGMGSSLKGHAWLWVLSILFICGMPPSVLFVTELGLVCNAPLGVAALLLLLLFIVFAAMSRVMLAMTMGKPGHHPEPLPKKLAVVPWILMGGLLIFGFLFTSDIILGALLGY